MLRFLARRLTGSAVALLVSSFGVFGAMYLAPGDPVSFLIGNRGSTPELRAALRSQYRLDDPFLERYWRWLGSAVQGQFGESLLQRQSVSGLISARLATTAWLVALAFIVAVAVGVCVGVAAGRWPRRLLDDAVSVAVSASIATPAFVSAVLLISLFAVGTGWFPVFGSGSGSVVGRLHHLALPAVSLAIGWWALIAQTTRASIRSELGKEHVETALARGLSSGQVFRRHVLRNALIPISTSGGLTLAGLIAGTAIVETAFQLDGVGGLLISAVSGRDFPVVQAVVLLLVVAFALVNTAVDVLYTVLDPRVRLGSAA
ncbi:ABC transporter permease [Kribbella turkmenica]|uniref:ABC transporter permease n=1 Tax=Kribbella turkmenica TaxID=2530375 RepID=A0A4R4XI48_9ACTN|nr:ABC transporter permease [Kribbella turkmenica]TDD30495.1 ABC transporter permease [Kribbella turkmenica]